MKMISTMVCLFFHTDNKSDSEMYTENSDRGRTPSPSGDRMTKLQKMKLDKK